MDWVGAGPGHGHARGRSGNVGREQEKGTVGAHGWTTMEAWGGGEGGGGGGGGGRGGGRLLEL